MRSRDSATRVETETSHGVVNVVSTATPTAIAGNTAPSPPPAAARPAMTKEKLDLQREVVRNERRQSYEIAPYGRGELAIFEHMFPRGHPYRLSVIGSHEEIEAAKAAGFDVCEIHTGPYAHEFLRCGGDLTTSKLAAELGSIVVAGSKVLGSGMRFNAGHALNYHNVRPIAALTGVNELHIGHAIVSRAVFTGLRAAVAEMKRLCGGCS